MRYNDAVTARRLAAVFILYGLVAVAFLAINMPPFQNPDEITHFMRAAQVAEGGLIGTRFYTVDDGVQRVWSGGPLDLALLRAYQPFADIPSHADARATRAMWTPPVHWSNTRWPLRFANTAVNPPWFYVPAAIGVLAGRATRTTVAQTLTTSRLLTGAAAVAVAALAIACAGGAAVWLFAILTLPMSLSLFASTSQEALMLACSALAAAMLLQLLRRPGGRDGKMLAALAATLTLVATARPPYGALALLPLGLTKLPFRSRILAASAIALGVFAWSGIAAATALTNIGSFRGADPAAQWALLSDDPLLLVRAVWASLTSVWTVYLAGFVGQLPWAYLPLPTAYRTAAYLVLIVAAVAAMLGLRGQPVSVGSRLTITLGLFLSVATIFVIEYVTWTVPGAVTVDGVEGRYFLPIALAGAALLPALGDTRLARLHEPLVVIVTAFPIVTLAVVMRAVVLRYYLQ